MRRAPLLLALLAALVAPASAQTVRATGDDGRPVLLLPDGSWIDADAVEEPLRDGQRLTSRTGVYELYVPTGWDVAKAKGPVIDGEFVLEDASMGAAAFVSFLSRDELGLGDLPLSSESGMALFWAGMSLEAAYAERGEPRRRLVGGVSFSTMEGEIRYPYEPTAAFRITTHTDARGMTVLLTTVEPGDLAAARPLLDRLHRSLAIRPADTILQGRAEPD